MILEKTVETQIRLLLRSSLIWVCTVCQQYYETLPERTFRAFVSYWRKYVHEVLVNRLGGLSLPRKSVVKLTDRPDMTLDVYPGRKTTIQQQQQENIHSSSVIKLWNHWSINRDMFSGRSEEIFILFIAYEAVQLDYEGWKLCLSKLISILSRNLSCIVTCKHSMAVWNLTSAEVTSRVANYDIVASQWHYLPWKQLF